MFIKIKFCQKQRNNTDLRAVVKFTAIERDVKIDYRLYKDKMVAIKRVTHTEIILKINTRNNPKSQLWGLAEK